MSEVGRQLVTNDRKRNACLKRARECAGELIVKVSVTGEDALARLNAPRVKTLVEQLIARKAELLELRDEYAELQAAVGDD